jgi:flagellar hook assembly protein FlgD
VFTPNGDGRTDTLPVTATMSEAGSIVLSVKNSAGTTVRSVTAPAGPRTGTLTWDGKASNGTIVPDGAYSLRFAPIDRAGNVGTVVGRRATVIAFLSHVSSSLNRFYPQDGDRFAPTTTLSFRIARKATVTWLITKMDGTPVRTVRNAAPVAAGTHRLVWNGLDQAGKLVRTGTYVSSVRAHDGTFDTAQKTWVEADAFTIRTTDTTPAPGQRVEITALSSEPLTGVPVLHVTQPGLATWAVKMTPVSALTWKAPITFKPSAAGQVSLRVSALDADGRWQRTYLALPLK